MTEQFLYYNFWPTLADHILDYPREHYTQAGVGQRHNNPPFYPRNIMNGDIVFVKTDLLEYFFQNLYPHFTNNFRLLSGIAGKDVEEKYKKYLDDGKIMKWIGTNIMWDHPKVMKIPIGFEEIERKGGDQNVLGRMYENRKSFNEKNDKLAITYLSDTHESRRHIKEFFSEKEYVKFLPKLEFTDYLNAINENRFVLCPRGCGTDTHRFWEVIFTGSIPVLETGGLDDLYRKFPCIIVNDFKEVTKELLDNFVVDPEKVKNVDEYLVIKNLKKQILG